MPPVKRLDKLLAEFKEGNTDEKVLTLAKMRRYIAAQRLDVIEEEIMCVPTLRELRVLFGCGLRGVLWDMAARRKLQLLGFEPASPRTLVSSSRGDESGI